MTTLTNQQMLNNLTTILSQMVMTEEEDFKKEINKAAKNAKKGNTTLKKKKEPKEPKEPKGPKGPTHYQLFFKEKYPEVKDKYEPNERMKAISILWKEHKEDETFAFLYGKK